MAKAQSDRPKRFLILFGLGVMVFALVVPLLALIPRGGQLPPPSDLQAHQEIVSEVILAKDRVALIGDSPTRGNPEAQLVLLKFSDFQCPFCGRAADDMKAFMNDNETDVLYVYKHFPLTRIHPEAIPAARASWAAQQQGQFWAYHDALFAGQDRLGDDLYAEIAQTLGLNMDQFEQDRTGAASREAVEQDQELTRELRLSSTPTFVLNNLLVPGGTPMEFFETVVEQQQGT